MKKIAIIGGGISGLYFANLLQKNQQYKYKIFEKKSNFELNDDMTLSHFIKTYENKFSTSLSMVLYGTSIMFANFMPCSDSDKLLSEIFKEKYDVNLYYRNVEMVIASEDDTLELPVIQINLKKGRGEEKV